MAIGWCRSSWHRDPWSAQHGRSGRTAKKPTCKPDQEFKLRRLKHGQLHCSITLLIKVGFKQNRCRQKAIWNTYPSAPTLLPTDHCEECYETMKLIVGTTFFKWESKLSCDRQSDLSSDSCFFVFSLARPCLVLALGPNSIENCWMLNTKKI